MTNSTGCRVLFVAFLTGVLNLSQAFDTPANELIVPFGSEFAVSSYAGFDHFDPAISMMPDGRFRVAWMSNRDPIQDANQSEWGAYSREFSPLGSPLGPEFRLNNKLKGLQRQPDVACAADGSFLATWVSQELSSEPDRERTNAFARAFDPNGNPRGAELPLSSSPTGHESGATPTALANGGFVVAWVVPGDGVTEYGDRAVLGQRFDADGERLGTGFRINTTFGQASSPGVASRVDGGFIVAWTHVVAHSPTWVLSTLGQVFDASGAKLESELVLGAADKGKRKLPALSAGHDGTFVVAWGTGEYDDEYTNPGARDVVVRTFTADGSPSTEPFRPYADPAGRQVAPGVAHTGDRRFVVVWEDGCGPACYRDVPNRDGDGFGIFARMFDDNGEPTSPEFQVNTYTTGNQWFDVPPTRGVAADAEGNFVVAWVSNYEVFARRFCHFDDAGTACGDADCLGAASTTSDALAILQSAVALHQCPPCLCDVDGSGATTATDALVSLHRAVGLGSALACPAC